MATIQDIADKVGISKAAVSRILNNKGSFSKETRNKVFKTAQDLNYILPQELKSLAEKDFKLLAVVLPVMESLYYSVLSSYLEQEAFKYGYSLIICSSYYDKAKEEKFMKYLEEKKINGVIFFSLTHEVKVDKNLPVITVGQKIDENIPSVTSDNYMSGLLAAKHLKSKGCKNYIYISAYKLGDNKDQRYIGFSDYLNKENLKVNAYFTGTNEKNSDIPSVISKMFIENPQADGLFIESPKIAMNVMQVSKDLGIDIPNNLKIVSYSNEILNQYSYPKLTYIKENTRLLAKAAIERLIDLIEENNVDNNLHEVIPVSLVQQTTT